jgi:hypothetical protein
LIEKTGLLIKVMVCRRNPRIGYFITPGDVTPLVSAV